ncbi:MAG: hypothetical protein Q8898_05520 [Bacillota bacterium]|nr:hypothetical protein [Bacillota bacterium]
MQSFKSIIEALSEDVNSDESEIIAYCEKTTDFLFILIKWGCIPFFIFVLYSFLHLR